MKRRILLTILIIVGVGAYAQESRSLAPLYEHIGESLSIDTTFKSFERNNFYASDYIVLNPGFDCKGRRKKKTPGSSYWYNSTTDDDDGCMSKGIHYNFVWYDCTTDFKISEDSVYMPYYGLYGGPNSEDNGCVGTLGGTIDVSSLGGAVYSIPIEVPTGINGMQPNLTITYNSQGEYGLFGWCWDLSGLSSITRTGKTMYHDNAVGGVTLDDEEDRFLLDGLRLIEVADYGNQIEYRTEQDGMAKIIAYKPSVIDKFIVWQPDGTILEYGCTVDSRIEPQNGGTHALCWLLNKVSDRYGNSIVYHYLECTNSGEYYISHIDYTSNVNQNITPAFSIEFSYYQDSDLSYKFGYVAGNLVQQKKLIKNVTIKKLDDDLNLGSYSFQYRKSKQRSYYHDVKMFSRLESITLEKDGIALNPTRITWKSNGGDVVGIMDERREISSSIYNNFPFIGDFNGDGFSDLIVVPYKNDSMYYPENINANVHFNRHTSGIVFNVSPNVVLPNIDKSLDWIYVLDINDDGLDDLLLIYCDSVDDGITSKIMLYKNNDGTSFTPLFDSPFQINGEPIVQIGDFEGLGRSGFITMANNVNTISESHYFHFDGENVVNESISMLGSQDDLQNVFQLLVGDFLGNGREQLFIMRDTCSQVCSLTYANGQYDFQENFRNSNIRHPGNDTLPNQAFPGDYNGDGLTDLLYYSNDNTRAHQWDLFFSKGTEFDNPKSCGFCNYHLPDYELYCNSLRKVINQNRTITDWRYNACPADFDGDGTTDLAIMTYEGGYSGINVYFKFLPDSDNQDECSYRSWFSSGYYNGDHGWGSHSSHFYFGCQSQYLHLGTFTKKGCTSFLCLEYRKDNLHTLARRPGVFTFKAARDLNHVSSISNGLGNRINISYKWQMQPYCEYQHGIRRLNTPLHVIDSYSTYNAAGKPMTSKYEFSDLLYHRDGHGYLGFLQQVVQNKEDNVNVSQTITTNEILTMGTYAFALPDEIKTQVYHNDEWKDSYKKIFTFRKVTSSLNSKIICPAIMNTTEYYFNVDDPENGPYLHTDYTEYTYSFGDGNTYYNNYNCTNTKHGTDVSLMNNADDCEFVTNETYLYFPDKYDTWTINKLRNKVVVQSRRGKPDVGHSWWYEYSSPDSYQIDKLYDIPCQKNNHDPLTLQTDFEYYPEGNLKKKTVSVPHAKQGEQSKVTEYEYGPGEGNDCQHRLISKVTSSSEGLSYKTSYLYDDFDNVIETKGSNDLTTTHSTEPFGITTTETNPNGVSSSTTLRWVTNGDNGTSVCVRVPETALYYSWSKTEGSQPTRIYYDNAGNNLRSVSFGLHGEPIMTDRLYDSRGRLWKVSNPYMNGDNIQWTEYQYDDINRLVSTTTPDGTVTSVTYSGLQTTTTIIPVEGTAQESETTVNAMGWVIKSRDASQSYVTYDYFADGLLASAMVNDMPSTTISATYDAARNRSTLTDPNYGMLSTTYNAYGELKRRITSKEAANGKKTTFLYDGMGRLIHKADRMENTETIYVYENDNGTLKGTLSEILFRERNGDNIQSITYKYDDLARLTKTIECRASGTFETELQYDKLSRISRKTFPTNVSVNYSYQHGFIQTISDANGNPLWHTDDFNAFGQLVDATLGSDIYTHRAYNDEMHYVDSIVTSKNLQNLSYDFDKFGNLQARKDNKRELEESFTYDKMNRLTGITMNGYTATMTYDEYGRMTAKEAIVSRIGMPNVVNVFTVSTFDSRRFHAVSKITIPSKDVFFPRENQFIEYTSFDKVKTIEQNGNALADLHSYDQHKTLSYLYGYNQQRISMKENIGGTMRTKQYVGNCEYIRENGTEKSLTYLVGPYGVFAVVEKQNDEENIHFILKDHLGSWTTITDAEGNVEQELSYDAWGNLRNPETWCNYTRNESVEAPMFDRGFTGHEHMTAFDLINMNGRCYDPIMSAFLSVDEYVQDPTCAQSFNKYAYCMNNPLRYVDPSGWQMVGGSTPKHYDWRDKEVPYEPRDFREDSPYMMNCNLHGASLYSGGCFSTSSYGYVAAHPQYSVEQQFALLRNWRDNPSTLNKMLMWNAGLSDINFGESYCNGIRNTHLSWECDGVAHTADIYGEYVGGTGCYVQVLSDLGGSGSYMPPGYNYASSESAWTSLGGIFCSYGGLLMTMESTMQYNQYFGFWRGKNGKYYDFSFHGNQYTGGMKQYALKTSGKFTRFSQVFSGLGVAVSIVQLSNATSTYEQLGYGLDVFWGVGAIVAPEIMGIPSTLWFFGGKQIANWYNATTITPMIGNGINPGLMIYQPSK